MPQKSCTKIAFLALNLHFISYLDAQSDSALKENESRPRHSNLNKIFKYPLPLNHLFMQENKKSCNLSKFLMHKKYCSLEIAQDRHGSLHFHSCLSFQRMPMVHNFFFFFLQSNREKLLFRKRKMIS